jgi:hypothetical protein
MSQSIDLRLAHTYIPAFKSICRVVALALVLTDWGRLVGYSWAYQTVLLSLVGPLLVVDRTMRIEAIFDSNALMCSIYVSYLIQYITSYCGDYPLEQAGVLASPSWYGTPTHRMGFRVVQTIYTLVCVLHIADVMDASGVINKVACYASALMFSVCVLLQDSDHAHDPLMGAGAVMLYTVVCICWIYALGIRRMVNILNTTTRIPIGVITCEKNGKRGTGLVVVQSFAPCFNRFGCILFTTGWNQLFSLVACTITLVHVVVSELQPIGWVLGDNVHHEYMVPCSDAHADIPIVTVQRDASAGAAMCAGGFSLSATKAPSYPMGSIAVVRNDTNMGEMEDSTLEMKTPEMKTPAQISPETPACSGEANPAISQSDMEVFLLARQQQGASSWPP